MPTTPDLSNKEIIEAANATVGKLVETIEKDFANFRREQIAMGRTAGPLMAVLKTLMDDLNNWHSNLVASLREPKGTVQ